MFELKRIDDRASVSLPIYAGTEEFSYVTFVPSRRHTYLRTVTNVYRTWYVLLLNRDNWNLETTEIPLAKKLLAELQTKTMAERQVYLRSQMPTDITNILFKNVPLQNLVGALDKITSCYIAEDMT